MTESIVHFMHMNVQSLLLREILMYYCVRTRILNLTASIYYSCWIICYCCMGTLETIKSVFPAAPTLLCVSGGSGRDDTQYMWLIKVGQGLFLLLSWVRSKGGRCTNCWVDAKPSRPFSHFNVRFGKSLCRSMGYNIARLDSVLCQSSFCCSVFTHTLKHCPDTVGVWRQMKIQAVIFQRHMHPYPHLPLELEEPKL